LLGDYIKEFDITDKLFYEVWKEKLNEAMAVIKEDKDSAPQPATTAASPWKL